MAQQSASSSASPPLPASASATSPSGDIPSLSSPWVVTSDNIRPAKPLLLAELLTLVQTNPTHLTNKSIRLVAPLHAYDATADTATLGTAAQHVSVSMGRMGGSSWRCDVGAWCQVIGECEWDEAGGLVVRARVVRELGAEWDMKLYEAVVHSKRAWERRISGEQQQQAQQQQQQ